MAIRVFPASQLSFFETLSGNRRDRSSSPKATARSVQKTSQKSALKSPAQVLPDPKSCLLIYDRKLESVSREFKAWTKNFPHRYAVSSGEKLKALKAFPGHIKRIDEIASSLSPRSMTIVAAGGGSVGDFAGFVASVYKRGVRLVHVPTTWLAAIDSSHGGKTALNTSGGKNQVAKNQIGTFYLASRVVLVRSILSCQPLARVQDAMGELGKIALIDGGKWVERMERSKKDGADLLWEFLKPAIEAKMAVVLRDPTESSGVRQILNLGHTAGHVFEAKFGWAHGYAVAQGLFFALEMSEAKGLLSEKDFDRSMSFLSGKLGLTPTRPERLMSRKEFETLLLKDKKRTTTSEVTFVFLKGIGRPVRVSVPIREISNEALRLGWIRR